MKQIHSHSIIHYGLLLFLLLLNAPATEKEFSSINHSKDTGFNYLESFCFDCHDAESKKGNLDLTHLFSQPDQDLTLIFENLISSRMPPAKKKQPTPLCNLYLELLHHHGIDAAEFGSGQKNLDLLAS